MQKWTKAQGLTIVAFHSDVGVSGGADVEDRPGLLAALDALSDLDAGILLVSKRDRLARDVALAALIERLVERKGAVVRSVDGVANGEGPEQALLRDIVNAFASYERQIIRARTKGALAAKAARGERVGGIPYGHRLATDGVHLEEEPAEQNAIKAAKALRAKGLSLRRIGEELVRKGMRPRNGRDRWSPMAVRSLVAEPISTV